MIWPFLMIYASEKLSLSLSTVSTLITINAATGLLTSFVAGAVADKLGRKLVMVASLAVNGLGYLFMSQAHTYLGFAILMLVMGASNPLYQVGADAMLADMIGPEKRTNAYAIIRMINNAGIAIGPAVGGFLAAKSYTYAFMGAARGCLSIACCFSSAPMKHYPNRINWKRTRIRRAWEATSQSSATVPM